MLPPRLAVVHDMLPPCAVAADVGCDHGLLSVALLLSGRARRVIAADVSEASVRRAADSVRRLAPRHASAFEVRLGDGLQPLPAHDRVEAIAIAGLGLPRLHGILFDEEGGCTASALAVPTLVLQPLQPRVDRLASLRDRLWSHGYRVQEQRFAAGAGGRAPTLTLRAVAGAANRCSCTL